MRQSAVEEGATGPVLDPDFDKGFVHQDDRPFRFNHSLLPPREAPAPPEARLFRAVIVQAFADATMTIRPLEPHTDIASPAGLEAWVQEIDARIEAESARDEARRWLLEESRDFETVCDLAGIDPARVLGRARRLEKAGWPSAVPAFGPSAETTRAHPRVGGEVIVETAGERASEADRGPLAASSDGDSARRRISVEQLLVWTYRHQRSHAISEGRSSLDALADPMSKVRAPGLATALAVRSSLEHSSADPSSVPGNPYAHRREVLPPDAALVHKAVSALPEDARKIVIRHASAGTRPDDGRGIPRLKWEPIPAPSGRHGVWRAGEYSVVREEPRGLRPGLDYWPIEGERVPKGHWWLVRRVVSSAVVLEAACPVECLDQTPIISAAREGYKRWWDALDAVRWFHGCDPPRLTLWAVTDEMPPEI